MTGLLHNTTGSETKTRVPLLDGRLSPIIHLCDSVQFLTTVFIRFLPRKQLIWLCFPYLPLLNHDQLGKAECCSLDGFFFFPASILLAKISVILQPWVVFSSWGFLSLLHSALDSAHFYVSPTVHFVATAPPVQALTKHFVDVWVPVTKLLVTGDILL